METKSKIPVLVTTKKRGVFFGYIPNELSKAPKDIKLVDARNCIYWSADVKGFLGLAANGPTKDCRVGPKAKSFMVNDVTSIAECTKEAQKAWESEPWR